MIDITKTLNDFSPVYKDGYAEFSLPVLMNVAYKYLKLRVIPGESSYTVCCPDDLFREKNETQKFYFNSFMKHDKNYHYEILISDEGLVFKEFKNNYNPACAIDEFIRFFILFDDFIMDNNVIGNEEDFA